MVPHMGVGLLIKYEMSLDLIKIFPLWLSRVEKTLSSCSFLVLEV